jgi:malonyl CoA-acyl carrier protein transacylase
MGERPGGDGTGDAGDSPLIELLDPTSERQPGRRPRASRPASLDGLTIGILDIAKVRGDVFLDRIAELVTGRGLRIARFRKPTYTKPAPADLRGEIKTRCHALIEGLAD